MSTHHLLYPNAPKEVINTLFKLLFVAGDVAAFVDLVQRHTDLSVTVNLTRYPSRLSPSGTQPRLNNYIDPPDKKKNKGKEN